jgi:hypothetical protein
VIDSAFVGFSLFSRASQPAHCACVRIEAFDATFKMWKPHGLYCFAASQRLSVFPFRVGLATLCNNNSSLAYVRLRQLPRMRCSVSDWIGPIIETIGFISSYSEKP